MVLGGLAFLDTDGKVPSSNLPVGSGITLAQAIDGIYPVGSIYISALSTSPATLFGVGTWARHSNGKMFVSQDPNDTSFDVGSETGGSKTATPAGTNSAPAFTGGTDTSSAVSAGTPAGTNSTPVFTGSALATHAHELPFKKASGATGALSMIPQSVFGNGTNRASESVSAAPTNSTTSSAVALSEAKSAGTPAGTVSAPVFTGSALGTHQHTVTATGTVAAPVFTGSSGSVMNPYIVVYTWVRTA